MLRIAVALCAGALLSGCHGGERCRLRHENARLERENAALRAETKKLILENQSLRAELDEDEDEADDTGDEPGEDLMDPFPAPAVTIADAQAAYVAGDYAEAQR